MAKSYVDNNGNHIPISIGSYVAGAFYDVPQSPDSQRVASVPVSGQFTPNTADVWRTSNLSVLSILHDGVQYSTVSYTSDFVRCGVYAITTTSGGIEGLRFIAVSGPDDESINEAVGAGGYTYQNDIVSFMPMSEAEEHIVDDSEWDDSPSDNPLDPVNMDPRGGEFADTDPLGFGNDDIDIGDTVQELSYSGFITAYQLDAGEIISIGEAIFTTATWTNLWNKFNGVGDPINYIISAIEIPYNARSETIKNFNLGGVSVDGPNGPVALHVMNNRYHVLDFGSLALKETWGTEKDYSTTDVAIYLPYVGVKDLDTSIIMNSTIQVKCILDSWNGELLYVVVVNNKAAAYKYLGSKGIVYRFSGNCGTAVPIGKVDYSSQILALAGSFAAMGVGLATGMPTGALSYTVGNEFGSTGDISHGANQKMVGGGLAGMMGALTMGPKVSMAGGSGGAVARGDYQKPYLIIKQSVPIYPKDWRAHFGAPRYQTFRLNTLTGYVKCADVHADFIEGANDAERAAIEQALKAGVFMS